MPSSLYRPNSAPEKSHNLNHNIRLGISSDVEDIQTFNPPSLQGDERRISDQFDQVDDMLVHNLDQGIENKIFNDELSQRATYTNRSYIEVLRHFILLSIGISTALSACCIDYAIETITNYKYAAISWFIENYYDGMSISIPGFLWCLINSTLIGIASILVVFVSPVAAGSGIPQIKCYLNGLNVPRAMRFLTMFVKGVGIVLAVSGGLAVGKEGPMIHIGSVIAAGLSQGRFTFCKVSFRPFRVFRNDQEKRDFVSAGAAAGVAAAFGAPVGGLLFALEEGASFLYQRLTWFILFTSMVSMFTLALFKSLTHSFEFKFTPGGLLSFGTLDDLNNYNAYELLTFLLMGMIGGLSGAVFIKFNVILTRYRRRNVNTKFLKITEAMLIGSLTTTLAYTLIWFIRDCNALANTTSPFPLKIMCADNEFNSASTLLFSTPEKSLRTLLHDPYPTHNALTLTMFFIYYYILACVTYGLAVPSGLFIPSLLIGAAWGRLLGYLMYSINSTYFPNPCKFALIGAAAQLGGTVRMTLSLTVILMEATGNVIVGLPLLMTLTVAKYVGDKLTEGIYDEHIILSGMALLSWEPDPLSVTKRAYDVMSTSIVYLNPIMCVKDVVEILRKYFHHAFPIVDRTADGTLLGIISTDHIALLLHKKAYMNSDEVVNYTLTYDDYDDIYPSNLKLSDALDNLVEEDMECIFDFRPYMCEAPYTVPENMTMSRVFHLFRLLGLRHLPVVNSKNQLRGMITRKDLRRFRFAYNGDQYCVQELVFTKKM